MPVAADWATETPPRPLPVPPAAPRSLPWRALSGFEGEKATRCSRIGRRSGQRFALRTIFPGLAGRPDILAIDGIVPLRGATARLHDSRRWHEDHAAHAGAAALAEDANSAREAAGQARQPGGHVRSARPRRLGSATRHVALFDDRVRPADRGAARP